MSRDSRVRVLIVDDEPDIRFLLKSILEEGGYEVVEAPNGAVALAHVVESRPGLVVTDLMMPVMGGAELIARLRSDPETKSIPVVVVSAQHETSSLADGVVTKPFEPGKLLETVRVLARGGG
jgi:two-component system chemotaxis response regulator CheY